MDKRPLEEMLYRLYEHYVGRYGLRTGLELASDALVGCRERAVNRLQEGLTYRREGDHAPRAVSDRLKA